MSAVLGERRARSRRVRGDRRQDSLFDSPAATPAASAPAVARETLPAAPAGAAGAGPTLEALVSGAWEGLVAGAPAACPVCHGALAPRWSAGAGVVGGRCTDCHATLA